MFVASKSMTSPFQRPVFSVPLKTPSGTARYWSQRPKRRTLRIASSTPGGISNQPIAGGAVGVSQVSLIDNMDMGVSFKKVESLKEK